MPKSKKNGGILCGAATLLNFRSIPVKLGKRKVTEEMRKKIPHLLVGDSICVGCHLKIAKMTVNIPVENEEETEVSKSTSDDEYLHENQQDASVRSLNQLLTPFGHSPRFKI